VITYIQLPDLGVAAQGQTPFYAYGGTRRQGRSFESSGPTRLAPHMNHQVRAIRRMGRCLAGALKSMSQTELYYGRQQARRPLHSIFTGTAKTPQRSGSGGLSLRWRHSMRTGTSADIDRQKLLWPHLFSKSSVRRNLVLRLSSLLRGAWR